MNVEDGHTYGEDSQDHSESEGIDSVYERFDASLALMRASDDVSLSTAATRVSRKIDHGIIKVRTITDEETDINPITGFELSSRLRTLPVIEAVGDTEMHKIIPKLALRTGVLNTGIQEVTVKPGIVLNSAEFALYDDGDILQDLLRTVAVADQYPAKGYSRRYRDIYEDALRTQAKWLDSLGMAQSDFDPRVSDINRMLELTLSDEALEGDCGIDDWVAVIDRNFPKLSERQRDMVGYFKRPHVFIGLRELFLEEISQVKANTIHQDYLNQMNATQKAEIVALNILRRAFYNSAYTLN